MGVPAFFRWLSCKYPSILVYANESYKFGRGPDFDFNRDVDLTLPNANNAEFDNLYLDMNGIIHPCTHPTDKPAPKSEEEMMLAIFSYIDRLMAIVRPRRLLYMAVDGVAPRAKLNQQRSRRFRCGKERLVKEEEMDKIRKKLENDHAYLPKSVPSDHFDSNCITPGTEFMWRLSEYLRFYIADRLENNPGWESLKVILSDASVPGEGEHKVMDFIRKQRCQPGYDPNTRHCLCGADADLIMLGLISHEPHFTVIREEFVSNQAPICDLCRQRGHYFKDCIGVGENGGQSVGVDEPPPIQSEVRFFFIRLDVLREYLKQELVNKCAFPRDLERCIDDWVFICFFVGNDFLPSLPCLEIREKAINHLVDMYEELVTESEGKAYLCEESNGVPNMKVIKKLLVKISYCEDEIMIIKRQQDQRFREKRNRQLIEQGKEPEEHPDDYIRFGDDGYKMRYYVQKFRIKPDEVDTVSNDVSKHYARGLCWVLQYYYNGCPAWNWYYPYHYAPFASDFISGHVLSTTDKSFEEDSSKPFSPMQQLMAVYPASSSSLLPEPFRDLMSNPQSPIIDFYPSSFELDRNGKRFDWQSVVLLPFIEEKRLLKHVVPIERDLLTESEKKRNELGSDKLFFKVDKPNFLTDEAFSTFAQYILEIKKGNAHCKQGISKILGNIFGKVKFDGSGPNIGDKFEAPIEGLQAITEIKSVCLNFKNPSIKDGVKWIGKLLPNVKLPEPLLKLSLMSKNHSNYQRNENNNVYRKNREHLGRNRSFPYSRSSDASQYAPHPQRVDRTEPRSPAGDRNYHNVIRANNRYEPYRPVIGFNTRARGPSIRPMPIQRMVEHHDQAFNRDLWQLRNRYPQYQSGRFGRDNEDEPSRSNRFQRR